MGAIFVVRLPIPATLTLAVTIAEPRKGTAHG